MNRYLLDTNILLRLSDPNSVSYSLARDATYWLIDRGHKGYLTSQIIIEFWVVATRPVEVNGLGWTAERTRNQINQLMARFSLLEENSDIFTHWLQLVTTYQIKGKRTHDIRLMAVMKAHQITHLLTFNPDDFIPLNDIIIIHPQDLLH